MPLQRLTAMFSGGITLLRGIIMNDALTTTYSYLTSEEGSVAIMTVEVLTLGCVVMLTCLISYPEIAETLGTSG
jgi:hypothetical protein